MNTRTAVFVGLALTVIALAVTAWLYPSLPDQIPTHWNIHGEVDGWGHKPWAPYYAPGLMAFLLVLIFALPWLSPERFKVDAFRGTFNYVMVVVLGLMGYIQAITLRTALDPGSSRGRWLVVGLFLFFAIIGNVLGKVRRNFWIGIRTPWTLADDRVWVATHRLAARLFVAAGVVGAVVTGLGAPLIAGFAMIMAAALTPAVYSLVLSKRGEHGPVAGEQ